MERLTSAALFELVFLSDPQLAADGRRAYCVRTRIVRSDEGAPGYRARVCEVELTSDGRGATALRTVAEGPHGSDHPRPSPDGRRLAFLSVREGHDQAQVQVLDLAQGGEARAVTRLAGGVLEFSWHPDGSALLVRGCDEPPEPKAEEVVARTVTRLRSKEDGLPSPGLRGAHPPQAWHVPLVGEDGARVLTSFEDGVTEAVWAPAGDALWVLAAEDVAEADEWKASLWRVRPGSGDDTTPTPERVASGLARPSSLAVSEGGTVLAWLAPAEPADPASVVGLWNFAPDEGAPLLRSGHLAAAPAVGGDARHGRYPNRPVATREGWLVNANRGGTSGPVLIDAGGGRRPLMEGARVATAFAHAAGRTLVCTETPDRPGELMLIEPDGRERIVSDENGAFVARYRPVPASEPRRAPNGAGGVPWWRLDPVRPRPDRALVIQVHGGPRTNVGYGFQFEFQLLAARGYSVVFLNPRGSSSYGHEYGTAMLGAYGTVDAHDVLAVVDAALAEARGAAPAPMEAASATAERADDPAADPPVHLTGGSYGGFMTNWLLTRTDRFRSAVTQRSICNWSSFYGTSDIGYRFAESELRGNPWRDTDLLWSQSPLARVEEVVTPVLILHSDADHRCPVEQAEQWFVALKRIGKAETRLIRFPDEGHELSRSGRPDRRVRRLDEIVGWFETHP